MAILKDPDARLDYAFDWTAWLEEDETIVSWDFEVTLGDVVVDTDAELDGVVTVWLTGGTAGKAKVTCHIVTSVNRQDDRTMSITVKER
jgi:hypothetical protein